VKLDPSAAEACNRFAKRAESEPDAVNGDLTHIGDYHVDGLSLARVTVYLHLELMDIKEDGCAGAPAADKRGCNCASSTDGEARVLLVAVSAATMLTCDPFVRSPKKWTSNMRYHGIVVGDSRDMWHSPCFHAGLTTRWPHINNALKHPHGSLGEQRCPCW
jgi:hypothetical protein